MDEGWIDYFSEYACLSVIPIYSRPTLQSTCRLAKPGLRLDHVAAEDD